jgi:DNA (cytosine-5)-methyltransferase 1
MTDTIKSQMKPTYKVPSMEEVRSIPWNGFNAISTFSGCGGSSLGYRMAGFRVLWASEFIEAARDSYKANKAEYTKLDARDIRDVSADDILADIQMKPGELDLFDGSPPCASFSTAGKREAGWGKVKKYSDTEQRTDDLFFEFVRLVKGVQPKVFVAENVKGLTIGTAKEMLGDAQFDMFKAQEDTIYHSLCDAGYRVEWRVLNAADLGVPQARRRCIFVGVRNDLALSPAFPRPLGYQYSVRDALPWVLRQAANAAFGTMPEMRPADNPSLTIGASPNTGNGLCQPSMIECYQQQGGGFSDGPRKIDLEKPLPTVCGTQANQFYIKQKDGATGGDVPEETDISRYAIGKEWDNIKPGEQSEKYFSLVRPGLDSPCPTITQLGGTSISAASVTHPTEKRKFTIPELRRICGFPDDFILTGSYAQQWERLGRAVPPVMMSHIAAAVRDEILSKLCAE